MFRTGEPSSKRGGMTHRRLPCKTGVDRASLSTFAQGKVGSSLDSLDRIVTVPQLRAPLKPAAERKGNGPSRHANKCGPYRLLIRSGPTWPTWPTAGTFA
jgi:hypothetical protein